MPIQGGVVLTAVLPAAPPIVAIPATAETLPVFTGGGLTSKISDSVFRQADTGKKIIVGRSAVTANSLAPDLAIVIGDGAVGRGPRAIVIGDRAGSVISFAAGIADIIVIGTMAYGSGPGAIIIGTGSNGQLGKTDPVAIGTGATAGQKCVAVGASATALNNIGGIAIGENATTGPGTGGANLVIGRNAQAGGTGGLSIAIGNLALVNSAGGTHIAIGSGAQATGGGSGSGSIAIGKDTRAVHAGAVAIGVSATTTQIGEVVFGGAPTWPITLFTIRTAALTPVRHRNSPAGWCIRDVGNLNDIFQVDESVTANDTRLLLWDVTAGALKRVSIGAAGSGGAGFRLLRVI